MTAAEEIRKKVDEVQFWWHSIDLGGGTVTPGRKTPEQLGNEIKAMRLPDLKGKTVLDIGAWDGFFSFEAEKRGASQVLALDHYVWSMNMSKVIEYWEDCKRSGKVPEQYDSLPGMWMPKELPGKKGFDTARQILGSKVQSRVEDFMKADLEALGRFDVVLYLGVLYHVHNPFEAIQRLARVTREVAIIETEAIAVPGYEDRSFFEFYETNELNGDVNNWWVPTEKALAGMCRAAGFKRVEAQVSPPGGSNGKSSFFQRLFSPQNPLEPLHYRAIVHAWK